EGEFPRLKRLESNRRLDHNLQDFFGMLFGDLLDFHAAEARCDDPHPLDLPVENEAEVNLPLERFSDLDIDSLHDLALWAGLIGDEGFAKKLRRRGAHFIIGLAELDASRLAAAAGMDLGLHGPMPAAKFGRAIDRLLGTVGDRALRRCHTKIRQDLLGLILVNVQLRLLHVASCSAWRGLARAVIVVLRYEQLRGLLVLGAPAARRRHKGQTFRRGSGISCKNYCS